MLIRQIVMGRHAIEQVYIVKSLECGLYTEEAAIEEKVVLHNECLEQEVVPKSELVCDSPKHEPSSSIKLTGMNEPCRTDIEDDSSSAINVIDYERQNHVENSGNDNILHKKNGRYVCRHCDKRFATMCSLERHEGKHTVAETQKPPQHNCYVCRKHFSSVVALNQHLNMHADKLPYRCHICRTSGVGITSVRSMNKHMAIHEKNITIECVYCEERFFTLKECERHEQLVHGANKNQLEATPGFTTKRSKRGRKPFVSESSSKTIIVDGIKRYACAYCENSYSLLSTLRRHENIHTGAKQYNCNICDKTFHKSSCLLYHQLTHTSTTPYKCSQCGKGFKESVRLIEHRRIHSGEKPFQCKNCSSRFRIRTMLKKHVSKCGRLQTRIEECCCQLCNQTFSGYHELIRHTKETHKELLSAKETRCNHCDLCFKTMSAKLEHEFQHSQPGVIECAQCGRMFKQQANLIRHQKLHTKDALRFTCDVCGKSFTQAGSLKVHSRTHTGERPYPCDLCSERFHHSSSVARHKQLHYNINSKYYLSDSSTALSSKVQPDSKKT